MDYSFAKTVYSKFVIFGQTFCAQQAIVKAAAVTLTSLQQPEVHANTSHVASVSTVATALPKLI